MSEDGLLGLLFGEGGEAPRTDEAAAEEVRADVLAATLAAEQARSDPRLARATEAFLDGQAGLVTVQTRQLQDEHALRMTLLRDQAGEGRLRRLGQRIRLGTQLATALILTLVGIGLVLMLVEAFRSESVIVDAFDAPAGLASRGLTGKVVAGAVLDALTRLQAATHVSVTRRKVTNAWTGDIKVEVPETGVAIGEIDRLLKQRLGHDLHIGGDLVQTETGRLALTIRGDGVLPKTFTAEVGELPKLAVEGAEYVFGQSQPSFYAAYLDENGRSAEAVAICKEAFASDTVADRPYLLNTWADALINTGSPPQAALALYREALRLKPDFWPAYANVMNSNVGLGNEEEAWRAGNAMRQAAGGRPGRAREVYYENWDLITWNLQAWRSALVADAAAHEGVGTLEVGGAPLVADIDVRLHDTRDAELQLQTTPDADPATNAVTHFVRARLATETGDPRRAVAEMETFATAFDTPAVSANFPGYDCWIAPVEEAAGFPDKADAALGKGGRYVDCERFRGDILDGRGDWAGAQAAYAHAVAIAPDLPAGEYAWGLALARHGDLAGAVARLARASRLGPHWADPLKAWGDVLARQDRWSEAVAKYDAALRYAPGWAELRQARDTAAHRSS